MILLFLVPAVDSSGCPGTDTAIYDNCTVLDNRDVETTRQSFTFSSCHTPLVDLVAPNAGPSTDEITFFGRGFGMTPCQNEVTIGGQPCNVTATNGTMMSCRLSVDSGLEVGQLLAVEVGINNLGHTLNTVLKDNERFFVLLPHIDAVSPEVGSLSGGTSVTITGSGFYGSISDVTVMVSGLTCVVTSVSYTKVICTTSAGYALTANLSVTVFTSGGQQLPASCWGECEYTYSEVNTPTVTSVDPAIIYGPDVNITIRGTLFGNDPAAVTVRIGDTECTLDDIAPSVISCTPGFALAGNQALSVHINQKGYASHNLNDLEVVPTIYDINPSSGSLFGGTLLTIDGMGFADGDTQVTIDGSTCEVQSVTTSVIHCITPSGSNPMAVVEVTSNGEVFPSSSFNYSNEATPEVTSLSQYVGNPGDNITITGIVILLPL